MEWVQIRKEKNTFFFCYCSFQGWIYVELLQQEPMIVLPSSGLTGRAQLSLAADSFGYI